MLFTVLIALPIAAQDLDVLDDIEGNKVSLRVAFVAVPITTQNT